MQYRTPCRPTMPINIAQIYGKPNVPKSDKPSFSPMNLVFREKLCFLSEKLGLSPLKKGFMGHLACHAHHVDSA